MLWRKLLMATASPSATSTHWIIPGGRILTLVDGVLTTVDPAEGWPQWTDAGDPFVDAEKRVGTYEQINLGGGMGEVRSVRLRDDAGDREEVRSLGSYRGWATERVSVSMVDTGTGTNPYGYARPQWSMSTVGGASFDTSHCADWPWQQQSNGTISGKDNRSDFMRVIQDGYLPKMAYPSGACAAARFAVVLKPEATAIDPPQDGTDASGRAWLGWSIDASGTRRRIPDLTPDQARRLGQDEGFVPPDDAIVSSSDRSYAWQFLQPLGPMGSDAVLATGCLLYQESYVRHALPEERPFYTVGRAGYGSNHQAEPLLDGEVAWYHGSKASEAPVLITERRSTFVFLTCAITPAGLARIAITGSSVSRSTSVRINAMAFNVFKRRGGGYDVVWQSYQNGGGLDYRGSTFASEFVTSRNGWRTPVIWPVYSADGNPANGTVLGAYMPVWFQPDSPTLGSTPPDKPADWNDDAQGPWVEPPYDVDASLGWRGMRYWWPDQGEWHWQEDQNSTFADYGRFGYAAKVNPMYPDGPYARDGSGQWYGRGEFIVARHQDGSASSHAAGLIVPGIEAGPGGVVAPFAKVDGRDPVMRLLRWPGRSHALRMTQDGSWSYARDGGAWTKIQGIGSVQGTICVAATLHEEQSS